MPGEAAMSEAPAVEVDAVTDVAPPGWDVLTVDVPGGHVLQSTVWASQTVEEGWRSRFVTFTDGAGALVLTRRRAPLPGFLAYASRGPVAGEGGAPAAAARALALGRWARGAGATILAVDPELDADQAFEATLAAGGFVPAEEIQPSRHRLVVSWPQGTSEDTLFGGLSKTTRQRVRGAQRQAVLVREDTAGERLPDLGRSLDATAVLIAIRVQLVTVLFSYGKFDLAAIDLTTDALLFFLFGLAGHSLIVVLARAFYAAKDTRTPVIAAVLSVGVNVVVSVVTVGRLGLAGLALGIAAGAWFESLLLLGLLARRDPRFRPGAMARAALLDGVGAVLSGAAAWLVTAGAAAAGLSATAKLVDVFVGGAAFAAAAVVFLIYSRVLHLPELAGSLAIARSATRRLASLA
jgi:hypothetical protein